ncbi:type IX secretion system protein PorD [Pedobacter sp. GR22-6]|uniref:type IX secretion system protein PorD n=1 Tax=Pedobacter sp. GR22-6 TaxID=3127957 RepID=UPI00307ED44F
MKRYCLFLIFLLICSGTIQAQELNARVQVQAPSVPNIDKRNIEVLQTNIREFLNNNKWSNESYAPQERIECNFVITITEWDGNSNYKAEAQLQSSRPVYGSSYNSTLLNLSDKDFDFNYTEGQSLDFSDQNFISNLSSLLGFYAYTIIGLDKDSFSSLGGTPYFKKALNVVNNAQTSGNKGWKAIDGLRNRYWLNENLLNKGFEELRSFIYDYHYNGLDRLQDNAGRGVKKMLNLLSGLKTMDKQKVGSIFPNFYFASKADEIVNVFSIATGDPSDAVKAYNLLSQIDPANLNKYEALKQLNIPLK